MPSSPDTLASPAHLLPRRGGGGAGRGRRAPARGRQAQPWLGPARAAAPSAGKRDIRIVGVLAGLRVAAPPQVLPLSRPTVCPPSAAAAKPTAGGALRGAARCTSTI